MKSINPATEELIKEYVAHNHEEISQRISDLDTHYNEWRLLDVDVRIEVIAKIQEYLSEQKETLAQLITAEMGKPIQQSTLEVDKCIKLCSYYMVHGATQLAPRTIQTEAKSSFVSFEPLGVILGIMPWNFPLWQVFRFVIPTILAGNVVLLKHASSVSGCSLAIEQIFTSAYIKPILLSILLPGDQLESTIAHPQIRAVSMTGSTDAGKIVAAIAGKNMKKTVLELGGSDPYIVLKDADLPKAAEHCTTSRLINTGQSCIAAKRFIVEADIYDEFVEILAEQFNKHIVGSPLDEKTDLGPLASQQMLQTLQQQCAKLVAAGGQLLLENRNLPNKGYFISPNIIEMELEKAKQFSELEIFGPVAQIYKVDSVQTAIDLANDSPYGLGAAIFSQDIESATALATTQIQAGSVFINDFVKSDPRLPFGGIKQSGVGRELAEFGIHEFVNIKTISLQE